MIPFAPESAESLAARLREAVAGPPDGPGLGRRHVFDWPDGLRLVVVPETRPRWGRVLRVSARWLPGTPLAAAVEARGRPDVFVSDAWDRFLSLRPAVGRVRCFTWPVHSDETKWYTWHVNLSTEAAPCP